MFLPIFHSEWSDSTPNFEVLRNFEYVIFFKYVYYLYLKQLYQVFRFVYIGILKAFFEKKRFFCDKMPFLKLPFF